MLAAVDWFARRPKKGEQRPIGLAGYGEGGLLALYAAALDTRIDGALVSGYFDSRQAVWQEPIYRNMFGLLDQFGDAELASLVAPRALVIEACRVPEIAGPPPAREGRHGTAAPGRLTTPELVAVNSELARARELVSGLAMPNDFKLVASNEGKGPAGSAPALEAFLAALSADAKLTYVAKIEPMWVNFSVSQNQLAKRQDLIKRGLLAPPKA